jgi:hypothetical protein
LDTPCIEWKGEPNNSGYGSTYAEGAKHGAHRVAFCKASGRTLASIKGLVVRHRCDNRLCINPEHLELGTHLDNMADMRSRGRCNNEAKASIGEKNGRAKISPEVVQAIRSEYVAKSTTHGTVALALKYGLGQSQVYRIVTNQSWTQSKQSATTP